MTTSHRRAPADDRTDAPSGRRRRARWAALLVLTGSHLVIVLDATIVNVALSSVQQDIGFDQAALQWVVTAYTLTFGGFLLLGGRLADRFGRRRMFVLGASLFALGSLLGGLAESQAQLIAGRTVQGLAGAVLSPAALSLLLAVFPEQRARDRALGVWAVVSAGGNALGLILGGVLTQLLSWEWIFLISAPIGMAAALCGRYVLPEVPGGRTARVDVLGAVLGTVGLGALMYACVRMPEEGWSAPGVLGVLAGSVVLLTVFGRLQRTRQHALLPLRLLRDRTVLAADVIGLLFGAGVYALFYILSVFLGGTLGYEPLAIGFAILPLTVAISAAAWLADRLVRRVRPQYMILAGTLLTAAGLASLVRIAPDAVYATTVLPGLLCVGLGMGTAFVALTSAAVGEAAEEDSGVASGLFNAGQQIGGALGLALLTAVSTAYTRRLAGPAESPTAQDVTGGWSAAFLLAACLMLLGTAVAAGMGRWAKRRPDSAPPDGA